MRTHPRVQVRSSAIEVNEMRAFHACSAGFLLLAVSSAAAALPTGGLSPDPWQGQGEYFAQLVVLNASPVVVNSIQSPAVVKSISVPGLSTVNQVAALKLPGNSVNALIIAPVVTPEPATWLLLGTGLVGVFGFMLIRSARA
jgi:PEP-CTERM motif-containing protein